MAEIPKLAPEVEIPRPRSSGVAVVAVAALAMFTAVGASAFAVRVRMLAAHPCAARHAMWPRSVARTPIEARLEMRDAFLSAAARGDDETALELYRALPPDMDASRTLAQVYDVIVARQMSILQRDLARGDCEALRARVAWLERVAPDERIAVNARDCGKPQIVEVELVEAK